MSNIPATIFNGQVKKLKIPVSFNKSDLAKSFQLFITASLAILPSSTNSQYGAR